MNDKKVERFEDLIAWQKSRKASCAEVRSQLYVALDVEYVNHNSFTRLFTLTDEVGRIVGGLRASVAKQYKKTRLSGQ